LLWSGYWSRRCTWCGWPKCCWSWLNIALRFRLGVGLITARFRRGRNYRHVGSLLYLLGHHGRGLGLFLVAFACVHFCVDNHVCSACLFNALFLLLARPFFFFVPLVGCIRLEELRVKIAKISFFTLCWSWLLIFGGKFLKGRLPGSFLFLFFHLF
jgi:hypothetical protein